jgi:hypothetical protein
MGNYEGLHVRYGPKQFNDFFGDLTKLWQIGIVREYQGQYKRLLSRAGTLSVTQQVGGFISGLKDSIRLEVQASRPTTLTAVVGLARLYEARLQAQRRSTSFYETRRTVCVFMVIMNGWLSCCGLRQCLRHCWVPVASMGVFMVVVNVFCSWCCLRGSETTVVVVG